MKIISHFASLTGCLLLAPVLLCAQTAREEIHQNIKLSASNYVDYTNIQPSADYKLTPSPKGYEPFYINHYSRHGSRWLINSNQYTDVIDALKRGDKYGKLTEKGKETLEKLLEFHKTCTDRLGELTTVGERQHHGIAKRMTEHFPEVFSGNAYVDARSTVVIRCILSMEAECEEIAAYNKNIRFHNDVSESFQWYLNAHLPHHLREAMFKSYAITDEYSVKLVHPERVCSVLFNDQQYVNNNINMVSFMRHLFDIASNMQSHDTNISFYDIFTEDEIYDLWKLKNIDWYLRYGGAPATGSNIPFVQDKLLTNFIETADTIVNTNINGATLRFGHETVVLPLACLMELGNSSVQIENLDELDQHWANYRIFAMGCNIQWIYYRPKKGNGDILVKALLNEKEVTLPIKTDTYPYYKWNDLREYYLNKLQKYHDSLK